MAGLGSYLDLFLCLRESGSLNNHKHLSEVIISKIPSEISEEDHARIVEFCRMFANRVTKEWTESNRTLKTFLSNEVNNKWLETNIKWPACDTVDLVAVMAISGDLAHEPEYLPDPNTTVCTAEAGTSTEKENRVPFMDLCNKQKKRRSGSMINDNTEEELLYSYISKLQENGNFALSKIVEHLSKNPELVSDVTKLLFKQVLPKKLEEDSCLALCTSLKLSKWQYQTLRTFLKEENSSSALQSYQKLLCAKKRCYYPSVEHVEITEEGARIRLQGLLDHTVQRILLDLRPIASCTDKGLKLIWKWGLDGSSSQSNYKQCFSDPEFDDSSVVMTSIVPLRLSDEGKFIIWENPNPSSTYYCRPVKFTFTPETAELIKAEHTEMQREISELVPTKCGETEIAHELYMTMIDGKVANTIANVPSSATCPICMGKPSEMNNLELLATKPIREDIYQYGISSLHMKIRCMECILHISYNMDFQRWSARGGHKELKQVKKNATQQEFREQTGILIDIVKQGFGTTNDGNTARRFFGDYKKTAQITGIDENLICRFSVILQAISSGRKINIESFRSYCRETAEMYTHLYPWYYMPVSVQKLLMHGADICSHFSVLPIGFLSEEASEARNKDFRKIRENNTRKTGRIENNVNILHGLLISSDPHISRIRPKFSKQTHQDLLPEAVSLLQTDTECIGFEEVENILSQESENIDPLL